MTLLELCEPLLQSVCRVNRSARKGGQPTMEQVRGEILSRFETMKNQAAGESALAAQYERVYLPLVFFVDSMICESGLSWARGWTRLAYGPDINERAGDEKFFDLLTETLADTSKAAAERLAVFYICLGLGFTGWYAGQPEQLRKYMRDISERIRDQVDLDQSTRVCPEAYEHVDTSDLVQPPARRLVGLAIALVGLILVLFVANIYLFQRTSDRLSRALSVIVQADREASATKPARAGEGREP